MNDNKLLNTIKSRGYWRINFKPLADQGLELPRCREIVENSSVKLRGWYYPHVPHGGLVTGNNYKEGGIDWNAEKEVWRMYQSGQFIHYKSMEEDWLAEDSWFSERLREIKPRMVFDVLWAVYRITEIYEFAARLARAGLYKEGVEIDIQLGNVGGRKLEIITDVMRAPLFGEYKAGEDIKFVKAYTWQQLAEQDIKEQALGAIVYIFQRFGWDNPPIQVIQNDQEKLLTRRL